MASRTEPCTKQQSSFQTASAASQQPFFFKNHQNWQISRQLDTKTATPAFHIIDSYGLSHTVTEFIVEDLGSDFEQKLMQLKTPEEQQQWICRYLQGRLDQAISYQIHVEWYGDKLAIRFGEYGLKGGGRILALVCSGAQVVVGVGLTATGVGTVVGGALISSGISGGAYALQQEEEKFENSDYLKQTGYGVAGGLVSGGVSGGIGQLFSRSGAVIQTLGQALRGALGGAAGSAVSTTISEVTEKGTDLDPSIIFTKTFVGGLGGGFGSLVGSGVSGAMNCAGDLADDAIGGLINRVTTEVGDDAAAVMTQMIKKGIEGGASSASSKIITNLFEEDKSIGDGVFEAATIGFFLSSIITGLKENQRIQELNLAKDQREQTQKTLQDAKAEKINSEKAVQDLEKALEQSERTFAEKQSTLKGLQERIQESEFKQQQTEQRIAQTERTISQARTHAERAEQQLLAAQQEVLEAQQKISQNQQFLNEGQKSLAAHIQQLHEAEQAAQQNQSLYDKKVASVDKDIRKHLKNGEKAKIGDKYTKSPEKIREAQMQGKKIEWKKGQNRFVGIREEVRIKPISSDPLTQAQNRAQQAQQKVNHGQALVEQKQADLRAVQDQLSQCQQQADRTQAELQVAQEVQLKQADLKMAQEQLTSYQQEAGQAQQDMRAVEGNIAELERLAIALKEGRPDAQSKLQEALAKEDSLAALSRQQKATIRDLQRLHNEVRQERAARYDSLFRRPKRSNGSGDATGTALRPEPVAFAQDCELKELMPHVVLVQALELGTWTYCQDENTDWNRAGDPGEREYTALCSIKGVLNPQGVVGHHLQLEKLEFREKLMERPHTHWSWNQLVQPNGKLIDFGLGERPKNYWEDAPTALLEPLSAFEDSICHKPFGVAPYDTFVFGSHRLSKQSILLIPTYLESEVRAYLNPEAGFRGAIVTYDPQEKNLRSAVIDILEEHYPNTWHVCDEEGNLIGKEVQYSRENYDSGSGYSSKTCLKQSDGKVLCLIQKEGLDPTEQLCSAMQDYKGKSRRFIGLHTHSVTSHLEDKKIFKILKKFTISPETVKNSALFAGGIQKDIDAIAKLGVSKALKFYYAMLRDYNPNTGAPEVANYILNTAMHADLVSVFYQQYPSEKFNLSALDLKIIFESSQVYLRALIDDISSNVKAVDPEKRKIALESFKNYRSMLRECLNDMRQAKEQASSLRETEMKEDQYNEMRRPLCSMIGQEEWKKVKMPHKIEFDLGRNWPHTEEVYAYIYKILRALPSDLERLEAVYQQVIHQSSLEADPREQYRLNVLCSIIEYLAEEKIYLALRKDDTHSILAYKVSKDAGWLAEYGLEADDCMKTLGNCLFDNIAAHLPRNKTMSSEQLRKQVVKFMEENNEEYSEGPDYEGKELMYGAGLPDVFFDGWESYLQCMSMPQVWGTELEIKALASMLETPIVLITARDKPKIYNRSAANNPLFLHHLNGNHFESCTPSKGLDSNEIYRYIRSQDHY